MSEINQVTGKQLAAARALVGLGQVELAKAADISAPTLRRMEASKGALEGMKNNVAAVLRVLEEMKVEFIDGGVRLRAAVKPGD
ncbi:transcriptional regulator [Rhizobium sp. 2YAF20]|uniref:transcriptional regulator n=1 Tax=Rhizobium sp. 2YAF20 TaxID=3233027 RepID=UPI003F9CADC3